MGSSAQCIGVSRGTVSGNGTHAQCRHLCFVTSSTHTASPNAEQIEICSPRVNREGERVKRQRQARADMVADAGLPPMLTKLCQGTEGACYKGCRERRACEECCRKFMMGRWHCQRSTDSDAFSSHQGKPQGADHVVPVLDCSWGPLQSCLVGRKKSY